MSETTNNKTTLLRCAHCGNVAALNDGVNAYPYGFRVKCIVCEIQTGYGSKDRVVSEWNRRATDEWVYVKDAGLPCAGDYYATITKRSGDVIVAEVDLDMGIWFEAGTNTSFPDWQVIAYMPRRLPAPARVKEGE